MTNELNGGVDAGQPEVPVGGLVALALVFMLLIGGLIFLAIRHVAPVGEVDSGNNQQAKSFIRSLLRDPESARFRNLTELGPCIVGDVNGKNLYGAYSGYQPFFYNLESGKGRIDESDAALARTDPVDNANALVAFLNEKNACYADAKPTVRR